MADEWAEFRIKPQAANGNASADEWAEFRVPGSERGSGLRVTIPARPQEQERAAQPERSTADVVSGVGSTVTGGLIEGIPVLGPIIRGGVERAAAATDAAFSDRTYEENMQRLQADREMLKQEHPVLDTASQIVGGVAGTVPLVAAAPAAFGAAGGSLAARGAASAASGAGLGAADSAVRSGGDIAETVTGGIAGGVLGAAAPVVGQVVGRAAQGVADFVGDRAATKFAVRSAPTTEALKDQSQALYRQAEEIGAVVSPEAYQQLVVNIAREARAKGADRMLTPDLIRAVQRLAENADQPKTLAQLQTLREVVGMAGDSVKPRERAIVDTIIDKFDDWMETLPPSAVVSGDPRAASAVLRSARELWGQSRRSQEVEKIFSNAELTPERYEQELRNGFKALAKNARRMRGFNKIEQRAIRAVAQGTPVERVARMVGRADPRGWMGQLLGVGTLTGLGLAPAVGIAAAGHGAKRGADALLRQSADKAGAIVRLPRSTALPQPRQIDQQNIRQNAASLLLGAASSFR